MPRQHAKEAARKAMYTHLDDVEERRAWDGAVPGVLATSGALQAAVDDARRWMTQVRAQPASAADAAAARRGSGDTVGEADDELEDIADEWEVQGRRKGKAGKQNARGSRR